MKRFEQPFSFRNGVQLRNSVVMAPMTTWSGTDDGQLTEDEFAYYRARANGVGMVITGTAFMTPNGKGFTGQYFAGNDATLPQLSRLADTIKAGGARAILQVFHAGRMATPPLAQGYDVVSASDIPMPYPGMATPRPMSEDEIQEVIDSFAAVTERAMRAGFDGVEIHGANTYLIQQFFSPHANRRTDQWGGPRENRARFPLAIVDAVLAIARSNPQFIVGYRLSPEELEEPGITLEDTDYLVDRLASTGLDYLHLSLRHFASTSIRDINDRQSVGQRIAEMIQGRVPLIGVGQIESIADLEDALGIGYSLVSVGKALIYDPQWYEEIVRNEQPVNALSKESPALMAVPQGLWDALFERREYMGARYACD